MFRMTTLIFTTIVSAAALIACATDQGPSIDESEPSPHIQTAEQLAAYMNSTPSSPLSHLAPDARQRFVDSMVFGANGLASYSYSDLQALSATEVYRILRIFNVEATTPLISKAKVSSESDRAVMNVITAGYENYYCASRATCSAQLNSICTDNC